MSKMFCGVVPMTWFNVKFIFDNDKTQHLEYYVEALDIIEAENKAFQKLGENGKKHKTSAEITPIVLDLTLGKPGKKYENFKDQFSDDPHIAEIALRYLRGEKQIKEEIESMLEKMFSPLGKVYQDQSISTLKMLVGLAAALDYAKYGDKPYLREWLKELYLMKTPLIIDGEHAPKPTSNHKCDFCDPPKSFETWDLMANHITIVHNDKGRTLEFYNGKIPDEILNHPDWTGVQN